MADKKEKTEETGDAEDGAESPKPKGKAKKILLFVVAPLVLVLVAGGVAYSMGWVHAMLGIKQGKSEAVLSLGKPVLVELPEIRTDMKTGECRSPFLRAVVQVQLAPEDASRIEESKEVIMDGILAHLRDQERQNVVGKEGTERLRFELVQIIENRIQPIKIHTVLFKTLIVQ